jgi:hypothetical protein
VINILYVYTVYVKTIKMKQFLLLLSDLAAFSSYKPQVHWGASPPIIGKAIALQKEK